MTNTLHPFIPICDAIAALLAGRAEVVLHDLRSGTIAHIANSFSNRSAGDDSLLEEEVAFLSGTVTTVIGPYRKRHWDGQALKSVTAVLRDGAGQVIGLMCINMKTGDLEAAAQMLMALAGGVEDQQARPLMAGDWRETANEVIARTLDQRQIPLIGAGRADRIAVLAAIDDAGVLQVRGAADYVASVLGISRASLYTALRQARTQKTEGQN